MPPSGHMLYWRWKRKDGQPAIWLFGYCTWVGSGLVRMGAWNGDTSHGNVVDPADIEWRPYVAQ